MELHRRIVAARKNKGLTQEELASLAKLTVRTIQRIESGETVPRSFTLRAIALALDKPFEFFADHETMATDPVERQEPKTVSGQNDVIHFLQLLNLSCFCYLVLPFIHFLVPGYLLQKGKGRDPRVIDFAKKIIRQQVSWVVTTHLLMLLTLAYNFIQASFWGNRFFIHYLWPFFVMYFLNAVIILSTALRIKKSGFMSPAPVTTT